MKIKFLTLALQCRQSREVINFSSQISYFHGQISAGKSSIMRLIDYCLGGRLERTPAISKELVSVELTAQIGDYVTLFERDAQSTNHVQVTWQKSKDQTASVLAPIDINTQTAEPIWEGNVYNLSDLLFYLSNLTPIKVRKSKHQEDSPLVRLSFRDIMWYSYLDQDHLDSSFYRLEDPSRQYKSRDAMRFITGFYTERMSLLETELDEVATNRFAKIDAANQVRGFLKDFGFGVEMDVLEEDAKIDTEIHEIQQRLTIIREQHKTETHFADELRGKLRELSESLANEEEALNDLYGRIAEQETLKAELLTAKFKLARSESASAILTGVRFECCPSCGTKLDRIEYDQNVCYLCGRKPESTESKIVPQAEIVRRDLISRIDDLAESIERHKKAYVKQERIVANIKARKAELDAQLNDELQNYDSAYLSNTREFERRVATLQERKHGLQRITRMLESINDLEKEAERLHKRQDELRKELENEKNKLTEADKRIRYIEQAYLDILISVGVPGIREDDVIEINRKTWIPYIVPKEGDAYNFYNAGSGGKKTLLNVCYSLAIHKVAAEHKLPLPAFLMIDSPMKNISEDVNRDIFNAFYLHLYKLAAGSLAEKQIILVDKEFFGPNAENGLNIYERFMSPDNPLISYYRGP